MKNLPLTVKRSIELLGLCAVGLIVVLGQSILMPLLPALFVSILMLPILRWLLSKHVPEALAIVICIIAFFIVIVAIGFFLSYQVSGLLSDTASIQKNLTIHWNNLSAWIASKTNFSSEEQLNLIKQQGEKLGNNVSSGVKGALASISGIFVFVGLMPIYIFLILFYRHLLLRFIFLWFDEPEHLKVLNAVKEIEVIVKSYLLGLLIQIAYLTILLGGILMLVGIKHAILIGVTFAILNLIPYLGALVGNLIGVLLTVSTSQELWQIWAVLGTIALVQFLDNNILMPRIVGGKVKVNALASIVGIIVAGTMAGIGGMFLSIPIMAVLKIVFDKSTRLRHWGVLLGDERPEQNPINNRIFRLKSHSNK